MRRSLEESLERLGLDRVDIAFIHDPEEHLEQALRESWPALMRLREQGVVGAIGVGTNVPATVIRFAHQTDLDCALIAGRLTLLDRDASEEALPLCADRGIAVAVGGPFNSGILAAQGDGMFDYAPADAQVRERVASLSDRCSRQGVPLAAAAVQFPLRHPAVATVIAGMRSPGEVEEDLTAFSFEIPESLWAELEVA